MHEQSYTDTGGIGFQNFSGLTQKPLSPLFGFERESYGSQDEAVKAAQQRSWKFGLMLDEVMRRRGDLRELLGLMPLFISPQAHP